MQGLLKPHGTRGRLRNNGNSNSNSHYANRNTDADTFHRTRSPQAARGVTATNQAHHAHEVQWKLRQILRGSRLAGCGVDKQYFEVTPSIGREFTKDLQLKALLEAPDSEALLRDLAVMVSRRGVCFFRGQDISGQEMLELASRMADATGRPKESKLCSEWSLWITLKPVHPVSEVTPELMTGRANQTMEISASKQRKGGGINRRYEDVSRWASVAWHTDISFERVPSDYSMLKINTLPPSGGDTLWINTADVVERMSPSFREYLEGLTAEHNGELACRCISTC